MVGGIVAGARKAFHPRRQSGAGKNPPANASESDARGLRPGQRLAGEWREAGRGGRDVSGGNGGCGVLRGVSGKPAGPASGGELPVGRGGGCGIRSYAKRNSTWSGGVPAAKNSDGRLRRQRGDGAG